ncbi:MAG: hypothetical protein M5U28_08420 [Sandaracinaceae bacterium]|nr:hypothetical protein [Sandaracinaceae bacterium]
MVSPMPKRAREDARDDAVRRPALVRHAAEGARLALAGRDAREELRDEARLADAGAADDADGLGGARGDGAGERLIELAELALAADERRAPGWGSRRARAWWDPLCSSQASEIGADST